MYGATSSLYMGSTSALSVPLRSVEADAEPPLDKGEGGLTLLQRSFFDMVTD